MLIAFLTEFASTGWARPYWKKTVTLLSQLRPWQLMESRIQSLERFCWDTLERITMPTTRVSHQAQLKTEAFRPNLISLKTQLSEMRRSNLWASVINIKGELFPVTVEENNGEGLRRTACTRSHNRDAKSRPMYSYLKIAQSSICALTSYR
ncbi:hypothetical protein BDW68DRAFT_166512 [Aspergillus falconensis]